MGAGGVPLDELAVVVDVIDVIDVIEVAALVEGVELAGLVDGDVVCLGCCFGCDWCVCFDILLLGEILVIDEIID